MFELASWSIGTIKFFMESFAKLSLIVLGDVLLGVKFMKSVGKRATGLEGTETCQLPVFANFSLVLGPEALNVSHLVILCLKCFLVSLNANLVLLVL